MDTFDWDMFWQIWGTPIRIIALLVGAGILRAALRFSIKRVVDRVVSGVKKAQAVEHTVELSASPLHAVRVVQRTRTIGSVLNNLATWAIISVTLVLVLAELNFSVTALIASAGVLGAALGFGAQNVVKDMLNGLFMVFEDQLGVGDIVELTSTQGPVSGVVEEVGVRVTQVRDVNGTLWFVRNGEIVTVGNKSQGWARVILDIPAPYTSDVEAVRGGHARHRGRAQRGARVASARCSRSPRSGASSRSRPRRSWCAWSSRCAPPTSSTSRASCACASSSPSTRWASPCRR